MEDSFIVGVPCCMWQNVGLRSWKSFRVKKWGLEPSSLAEVYTYAICYICVPWKFYPTCALVRDATSWTSHRHAKSSTHQLASTKSHCTKESTCQLGSEVYMSTMMTCWINNTDFNSYDFGDLTFFVSDLTLLLVTWPPPMVHIFFRLHRRITNIVAATPGLITCW